MSTASKNRRQLIQEIANLRTRVIDLEEVLARYHESAEAIDSIRNHLVGFLGSPYRNDKMTKTILERRGAGEGRAIADVVVMLLARLRAENAIAEWEIDKG